MVNFNLFLSGKRQHYFHQTFLYNTNLLTKTSSFFMVKMLSPNTFSSLNIFQQPSFSSFNMKRLKQKTNEG
jgi:hypothetical protein